MKEYHLYFASCVPDGGIYHYSFSDEGIKKKGFYQCDRPMFLSVSTEKLDVLLRQPFTENNYSGLQEYAIDSTGKMTLSKPAISTYGVVACHLCRFNDQVYVTNYLSGNVYCTTGKVDYHHGCGPNPVRQSSAHTHFVAPSPDGKNLLSTDLGLDAVYVYDKDLLVRSIAHVPSGHGPRHLAYSQDRSVVFCANELASTVTVFRYNDNHLFPVQTLPVLANHNAQSTVAAIRTCGDFVYVSNRGDDSISCLYWDGEQLELLSVTPCGGLSPRDFLIVEDTLICTNELSDCVSFLKVREEILVDTGIRLQIKKPVCVVAR